MLKRTALSWCAPFAAPLQSRNPAPSLSCELQCWTTEYEVFWSRSKPSPSAAPAVRLPKERSYCSVTAVESYDQMPAPQPDARQSAPLSDATEYSTVPFRTLPSGIPL